MMRASSVRATVHDIVEIRGQPNLHAVANKGVRKPPSSRDGAVKANDVPERLAHPSNSSVAQLSATWRVVDDPLQWRLQRKKGNSRRKNSGWRNRSYYTTREGLLRCIREHCGEVEPAALAKLGALAEHNAMQNLDVRGTDQAQAGGQAEPFVSQGLEACEADDHQQRSTRPALL
jgi:hypothetical protein